MYIPAKERKCVSLMKDNYFSKIVQCEPTFESGKNQILTFYFQILFECLRKMINFKTSIRGQGTCKRGGEKIQNAKNFKEIIE